MNNLFSRFYRISILGLAGLSIVAISSITQAQTQSTSDSSQPEPTLEPADQIPEVFTPQVPSIQQDTTQLQEQLQQDNVPAQPLLNESDSELNQINTEEQQLEQNEQEQSGHL